MFTKLRCIIQSLCDNTAYYSKIDTGCLLNYVVKNRGVSSCRAKGHMPISKYAQDKIQNSMFLPLMKKSTYRQNISITSKHFIYELIASSDILISIHAIIQSRNFD